jgi:hypothetical protein
MLNYSANGPSGYNLTNSLRFRASASAYLNRTFTTPTNNKIFTYSAWVKRGALNGYYALLSPASSGTGYTTLRFESGTDQLIFQEFTGSVYNYQFVTTQVFRDPSAWYHIVIAMDTTQATSSNRFKLYINGVQVTSFATASYPTQNSNPFFNSAVVHRIGANNYTGNVEQPFDGYQTEINWIDGQALTPSSFGNTNSVTGVWQPAKYTGTYGTNGFYLPFSSSYFGLSISSTSSFGFSTFAGSFVNESLGTLVKLPANATNLAIGTGDFTIEGWVNTTTNGRGSLIGIGAVNTAGSLWFGWENDSGSYIRFGATDVITSGLSLSSAGWVHIALTRSGSTVRLYKNGSLVSSGTSSTNLNLTDVSAIGGYGGSTPNSYTLQGSISNLRLVVGTALYTGSTYTVPTSALTAVSGTQLLTLQNATLKDNSTNNYAMTAVNPFALDASGNANNWQMANINVTTVGTTYDSMTDVPTLTSATVANYATFNPVNNLSAATISSANLNITSSANWKAVFATIGTTTGKFYCELTDITTGGGFFFGVATASNISQSKFTDNNYIGKFADDFGLRINNYGSGSSDNEGYSTNASFTTLGTTLPSNGTIYGLAVDLDNRKIYWSRNNTWYNSASPSAGTNGITITSSVEYFIGASPQSPEVVAINFGQRPFSYTPPSGYVALNTFNLPSSTIPQGNKYMDATLYTGTGSSLAVVNAAGFKPDLVYIANRVNAKNKPIFDSVRGVNQYLYTNSTSADLNIGGGLTAFNSNGFTVGGNSDTGDTVAMVGWQWQAGQGSTSSNTSGSITSTVSVNTTAGFSVATFTPPGSGSFTFGHGLGVAPKMVICKNRTSADNWLSWHGSLGGTQYLLLNLTNAVATNSTVYTASPTSTLINCGSYFSSNAGNYVCYSWAEIAGFSKFGSYTGNFNADGPFIYTGFRPKFVLFKSSGDTGSWNLLDATRNPSNVANLRLFPNNSNAEATSTFVDFLSNGFKIRTSDSDINYTVTNIYMAFAENPFKNALAR